MPTKLSRILAISLLAFSLSAGANIASAWTAPTAQPPAGNIAEPINATSTNQTKTGGLLSVFNLWIDSALGVTGNAYFTSGNVGIGTTDPKAKLDVVGRIYSKGSNAEYSFIGWDGTDIGNASYLYAGPRATGWNLIGSNKNGTGVLRGLGFTIGGGDDAASVKMVIDTAGNVGIGTGTPEAKLEVIDSLRITPRTAVPFACSSAKQGSMYFNSSTIKHMLCNGTSWVDYTGPQGIQGVKGDQGIQGVKGDQGIQGVKGDQGIQGVKGDQGIPGTNGTNGIDGAPGLKGDTGPAGASPFTLSGTDAYYTAGNVGIGTPTPGAKLSVMNTISGVTTGLNVSPFYFPSLTVTNCIYTGSSSNWCGGMSRYTLQSYTIPAYGGTELNAADSGGTARNLVLQTGTGNVGIGAGAKNPTYKLQVDGSLYVAGAAVIGSGSTLTVNGATTLAGGVSGDLNVTGNITTTSGYYISGGVYGGWWGKNQRIYYTNSTCTANPITTHMESGGDGVFSTWGSATYRVTPNYFIAPLVGCVPSGQRVRVCPAGQTQQNMMNYGDTQAYLCVRM